jgi:hypothetical protein
VACDVVVTCPLFVELCAGTAALSLRLHHPRARPPVSRMGAKTGYADVILRCMGLRPGQGSADGTRYLWCEPDAGVRLLLHSYRDRAVSLAAAEIIRGWKDEDPRALWERLRAEGPARCPPVDPAEVARFLYGTAASYGGPKGSLWDTFLHPEEGGRYGAARADVADKTAALPTVEATITDDARKVDPREVARWSWLLARSVGNKGPHAGYMPGDSEDGSGRWVNSQSGTAAKWSDAPTLPATITDDARAVDPPQLPPGVVAYIDPPYENTTSYSHKFPRSEWLPVVRRWAEAGALVVVSEAEPIPELMAGGWHAVEITGERKGQKRTFSKQQREWLTMSRAPAWKPSEQMRLFHGRS